jgi:hypothetical protein
MLSVAVILLWSAQPASCQPVPSARVEASDDPVVRYDMTALLGLDLEDAAARRRLWDESQLVAALQGLANRAEPRFYLRYNAAPDDFWWALMTEEGGWLAGRPVEQVPDLETLLTRLADCYRGVVVWDERVPATSNLASTLAGCEDLLPIRYDLAQGSLYSRLVTSGPRLPVAVRLMADDGSPLFTGQGAIPGTALPSTGSAKCDAYLWLVERVVKTGVADPHRMGYYLDGAWLNCWHAGGPALHTLTNHDYVIAHRGLLFDLSPWDDEAPVDDPGQKPGEDARTLRAILRAAYDRFAGDGVIHVAGFVPWAYKYTNYSTGRWSAGSRHEPVPAEWRYAEILSCFNAYMDADAIGYCPMANASFYQHFPLAATYPQPDPGDPESLRRLGVMDNLGTLLPRRYLAHYVGDYDAASWMYWMLPQVWNDPARGAEPLSWAFNPNLCERFPLGMAWTRETASPADSFVAGDSGAGYLNPGLLTEPRLHSGLPSGAAAWERHCERLYRQWDIEVTGFVIDGNGPPMAEETLDAYARFSPGGVVAQKTPELSLHNGMPLVRMATDLEHDTATAAAQVRQQFHGTAPQFVVCRSILKSPTWYKQVDDELRRLEGDRIRIVDLRTLLWLAREAQVRPERFGQPTSAYRGAARVEATPGAAHGLDAVWVNDGPVTPTDVDGVACWKVPRHEPGWYLYLDVDEGFRQSAGKRVTVEVEYLDAGTGMVALQYDSANRFAPMAGAYTDPGAPVERSGSGEWKTASWSLTDARFGGGQNSAADLRFYNAGDDLYIRAVRVLRAAP